MRFDAWMHAALYEPELGYYARPGRTLGRQGDFYTSASVGPVFGWLLAARIGWWMEKLAAEAPGSDLMLVEAGGHEGPLAAEVGLAWVKERPDWISRLRYLSIEPMEFLWNLQRERWKETGLPAVRARDLQEAMAMMPDQGGVGVFFANELLDAFPIRRFRWNVALKDWCEAYVGWEGSRFVWEWRNLRRGTDFPIIPEDTSGSTSKPELPEELADVLPDGFVWEASPAALEWWGRVSRLFQRGVWLTFDYGHDASSRWDPRRVGGSLRGYRGHRPVEDVLDSPGEQDLTAHVDWQAVCQRGEREGLRTVSLEAQERFLVQVANEAGWMQEGSVLSDAQQRRQFMELTHPGRLGRSFQALVQERVGMTR